MRAHVTVRSVTSPRWFWAGVLMASATGCNANLETTLQRLMEAQRLSAAMLVEFTNAADAANRAVMAIDDESSGAFAREAAQATQAVGTARDALAPLLAALGYTAEAGLLGEFDAAFAEYRALDDTILGLAVENTNLKAQRMSFGAAREAADAFVKGMEGVQATAPDDAWHVKALAASAVAGMREIQVLHAPHIAEADDAAMTRLETQMTTADAAIRKALDGLGKLVSRESQPQLAAAAAALSRFTTVHAEIIALSRRNSNVRSLALTLGQKRMLTATCEDALHALQASLAKRTVGGTR